MSLSNLQNIFCIESSFKIHTHVPILPGKCQVTWTIFLEIVKGLPVVGSILEHEVGTLRSLTSVIPCKVIGFAAINNKTLCSIM